MGTGLANGVAQGNAGPQQFRAARRHCRHASTGSDANTVIAFFNELSRAEPG
jgi:hypothetical protein